MRKNTKDFKEHIQCVWINRKMQTKSNDDHSKAFRAAKTSIHWILISKMPQCSYIISSFCKLLQIRIIHKDSFGSPNFSVWDMSEKIESYFSASHFFLYQSKYGDGMKDVRTPWWMAAILEFYTNFAIRGFLQEAELIIIPRILKKKSLKALCNFSIVGT